MAGLRVRRRGRLVARLRIRLDIGAVEKSLAFFNPGKGVADVGFAGPDRFDLATCEFEPGFVALEDMKIAQRFAVENRLGSH